MDSPHVRILVPTPVGVGYDSAVSPSTRETVTVDDRGRLIVPRAWRESLGLQPGETAVLENTGTEIRVTNARRDRAALIARLHGSVTAGDTVDDLLRDRRAEVAREPESDDR